MNVLKRIILIGLMLATGGIVNAEEQQRLVLVAHAGSDVPLLSPREVRKAYLGAALIKNGVRIQPLLNRTDESLYAVFLQKVMFMSSQAYQRHLLRRFLHAQGKAPPVYDDQAVLLKDIAEKPGAVTYLMWENDVKPYSGLKVIASLWDGKS